MDKCRNDYKRGELAATLYSEFYSETTREINALQGEIRELKERIEKASVRIEDPKTILSRLRVALKNWDSISNKSKKRIIAAFLPRIEVSKDKTIYVERNLPPSF